MTPTLDPTKLNNPVHAARCLWQGLALLARPELRHFVWMPLLLNLCLYALGLWAIRHYFDAAMAYLLPAWLDWVRWLLWPLVAGSFIALMFFSFTLLANLLGARFTAFWRKKRQCCWACRRRPRRSSLGRGRLGSAWRRSRPVCVITWCGRCRLCCCS